MGLSIDRQVTAMLAKINANPATPESIKHTAAEWVKSTYWLSSYLVWIGGALVVVGSVLGIIRLLVAHKGDDVHTSDYDQRQSGTP